MSNNNSIDSFLHEVLFKNESIKSLIFETLYHNKYQKLDHGGTFACCDEHTDYLNHSLLRSIEKFDTDHPDCQRQHLYTCIIWSLTMW